MRIWFRAMAIVGCLLMTQSLAALVSEPASAEWTEATWPCDVAPGATLAAPVLWFRSGEPATVQMSYFTYGLPPDSQDPRSSDFTAIANWGDGATSPATVEALPDEDCYGVSTSSHTYNSSGTYPFSYTVHDKSMGLDHTLGPRQLRIYSEIPDLLADPSPRAIEAIVGVPWSGVVGEFSSEVTVNPSYPYQAQIEWGDGEPATPGMISTTSLHGSSSTFTRQWFGRLQASAQRHDHRADLESGTAARKVAYGEG